MALTCPFEEKVDSFLQNFKSVYFQKINRGKEIHGGKKSFDCWHFYASYSVANFFFIWQE